MTNITEITTNNINTINNVNTKNTQPKMKLLLRTKSGSLDMAIAKLISLRMSEQGEFDWHIGISSKSIIMFDIDQVISEKEITQFAIRLKNLILTKHRIDNNIIIIRTNHGYHVVSNAVLNEKQWLSTYEHILNQIKDGNTDLPQLDRAHIELSIKYKSTTLRISPKYGDKEIYNVVKVV